MYQIISKKILNPNVIEIEVLAPLVAKKAKPGQFIILRVDEDGERVPFTIAKKDEEKGTISIIYQVVGATTRKLKEMEVGSSLASFVGPLGKATELDNIKSACVIGGGVGAAIALPIASKLHELGAKVTSIIGFRNKDLVILEDEFKKVSDSLLIMTDDGSYQRKGNVTIPLKELLNEDPRRFDKIIAIGPLVMMKYVTLTSKEFNVPIIVSMNPIMIDGTGMCGGCRLTLIKDNQRVTKFACIDGPDFNGYEVDFDEAMSRNKQYLEEERRSCNLLSKEVI